MWRRAVSLSSAHQLQNAPWPWRSSTLDLSRRFLTSVSSAASSSTTPFQRSAALSSPLAATASGFVSFSPFLSVCLPRKFAKVGYKKTSKPKNEGSYIYWLHLFIARSAEGQEKSKERILVSERQREAWK